MKKRFLIWCMVFVLTLNLTPVSAEEALDSGLLELSTEQKVSLLGNENVAFLKENEISLDKIEMATEAKRISLQKLKKLFHRK